jgi:hypothetical protein
MRRSTLARDGPFGGDLTVYVNVWSGSAVAVWLEE